ncbi:MAG: CBS domain-containing protein [Rhodospirillales bacterium]
MRISEILKSKGSGVFTMRPTESVTAAVRTFRERGIGAIIVRETGGDIAGIVTERDVLNDLADHGAETLAKSLSEVMSSVRVCAPDDKVRDVMGMMTLRRVRHAPVIDGGELVGMISIGDLVKHQLDETELEVNTMRDFARAH